MTAHTPLKSNGITATQIIVESLFAVLALGAIVVFGLRHASVLDPEFQNLALLLDYFVCFLFGAKALWDLGRAPDKLRWLKWGWADFAASIPEIEAFRGLRLLRLLLMFRLLCSTTRSIHGIATIFNVERARAVIATVFSLIVISLVTSGVLVLSVERTHPEANIRTAESAVLWAVGTLFGADSNLFGNHYAVTLGGRLLTFWLVFMSLGLIGSLAGVISSWIEKEPTSE